MQAVMSGSISEIIINSGYSYPEIEKMSSFIPEEKKRLQDILDKLNDNEDSLKEAMAGLATGSSVAEIRGALSGWDSFIKDIIDMSGKSIILILTGIQSWNNPFKISGVYKFGDADAALWDSALQLANGAEGNNGTGWLELAQRYRESADAAVLQLYKL
jgi:uncharacterized protein YukE